MAVYLYLRNRKHFPCFHTVIETRMEVWENFNFSFSQTSTNVSITYGNKGEMFSISFIK